MEIVTAEIVVIMAAMSALRILVLAAILFGCVENEGDEPAVSNVGKTILAMCGPAPELPKLEVVAEGDKLVISKASHDSISYYVFVNALWQDCVVDL